MSGPVVVDWRDLPPVPVEQRPVIPEGWRPSQTFLKEHDRCDRAAMLYLAWRAGGGGHELNRGAIFHDVIADLERECIANGEQRLDSPEIAKDALIAYMDANPHLQVNAAERDELRQMVTNWALGEYLPEVVLGVESTWALEIGGFTITGRIDRFDDLGGRMCQVLDYKTSWAMPSEDEFARQTFRDDGSPRWAGNFQTNIYALAVAFGTFDGIPIGDDFDRFRLALRFPRYLRPDGLGERAVIVTREQLLDFKLDVEQQLRRLVEVNFGEGKWQPTPGSHCAECPAANACPLPRVLREESQLADCDSIEDLERIATAANFMARDATKLKARVKKRALALEEETPGVLDLGGGDRGIRCGRDTAWLFLSSDREEIIDKAELAKAIEARVDYGADFDMADHVRRSQGTTFEKRKIPPR